MDHTAALLQLDAAYRRISEVRQHLMQLSNTLPHADDALDPGHDAIVLAGDSPLPSAPSGSSIPPLRPHQGSRPPHPTSARHMNDPPEFSMRQSSNTQSDQGYQNYLRLSQLHARWHQRHTAFANTQPHSEQDSSQTTLGRRVAARQAALSGSNAASSTGQAELDLSSRYTLATNIAQGIEDISNHLLPLTQNAAPPPPPSQSEQPDRSVRQATHSSHDSIPRRQDAEHAASQEHVERLRADLRQRLSTLSNMSVRNFSTPSSSVLYPERPLLFEEPVSYAQDETPTTDATRNTSLQSPPSYVIRRRYLHGREVVHSIPEDFLSRAMPERESSSQQQPQITSRPARGDRSMRQGTVPAHPEQIVHHIPHFDPDGNEIDLTDLSPEEAVYEVQIRLHRPSDPSGTFSRLGSQPPTGGSPNVAIVHPESFTNFTTALSNIVTSLTPGDGSSCPRTSTSSDGDYDASFGSAAPFVISPLPMPVQEMIPPVKGTYQPRVYQAAVPKQIALIGR